MQSMPNHACHRRLPLQQRVRPWPALTAEVQAQVAQQLSRLVQRLRLSQEARRADEAE